MRDPYAGQGEIGTDENIADKIEKREKVIKQMCDPYAGQGEIGTDENIADRLESVKGTTKVSNDDENVTDKIDNIGR